MVSRVTWSKAATSSQQSNHGNCCWLLDSIMPLALVGPGCAVGVSPMDGTKAHGSEFDDEVEIVRVRKWRE